MFNTPKFHAQDGASNSRVEVISLVAESIIGGLNTQQIRFRSSLILPTGSIVDEKDWFHPADSCNAKRGWQRRSDWQVVHCEHLKNESTTAARTCTMNMRRLELFDNLGPTGERTVMWLNIEAERRRTTSSS